MFQSYETAARPQDAPPRVAALRAWMEPRGLDAVIVPRADAYGGEYLAPCDERLAWISGFTGSAGTAAIARERAVVMTDGRYAVQVVAQTDPATFETAQIPEARLSDWLTEAVGEGGRVGYDPRLHTVAELRRLRAAAEGLALVPLEGGIDALWRDRPAAPAAPMTAWPPELSGRAHADKRAEIAAALRQGGAACFVTTQPDEVAWLLDLRGGDLARVPLAQAYAAIHADGRVDLICAPAKAAPVAEHLGGDVRVVPMQDLAAHLAALPGPAGFDPAATPEAVASALAAPREMPSPLALPKACKSAAEIAATREAHLRDGAGMVRFLHWFDTTDRAGLTEIGVARALEGFRRDTGRLHDLSFDAIVGSGPDGAIVHYRVTEETDRPLDRDALLLVDSGGQYLDGTTDVTRTVPLGRPPEAQRRTFTRVLQGMIAVSRARFPRGVAGCHLDALARAPLWAEGKDYDHGTGHGVGVFLGVHEGPQRLSRASSVPLAPGMILSNEPGHYRAGEYGIRIENLLVVVEADPPEGGDPGRAMLGFETLTWVPIDRRLIVAEMLGPDERAWIDAYHAGVAQRLAPRLDGPAAEWMAAMCAPLDPVDRRAGAV
jgi:Xaa-Pro aminopeptidase